MNYKIKLNKQLQISNLHNVIFINNIYIILIKILNLKLKLFTIYINTEELE